MVRANMEDYVVDDVSTIALLLYAPLINPREEEMAEE